MQHLFLHIGTNKTATSLIQSCCALQQGALRDAGIAYPTIGRRRRRDGQLESAHHHVGSAIRGNQVANPLLRCPVGIEALTETLLAETRGIPRVLLSTEMLWRLSPEWLPRLGVLFDAFDQVTLIAYCRRQDSWAPSVYGSKLKLRGMRDLPDFAQFCEETDLDVGRAMALWDAHRGAAELIVRPFVRAAWRDGDILADFFALIDPALPVPSAAGAERNEAWPLAAIALMRHLYRLDLPQVRRLGRLVADAAAGLPPPAGEGLLTCELQQRLLARYRASNARLGERFWSEEERRLFATQRVEYQPKPYAGPSAADTTAIIAAVWRAADAQADQQRRSHPA